MGMIKEKFQEISDEFNQIAKGNISFFEAILPIFLFLFLSDIWSFRAAALLSILAGLFFTARNIARRGAVIYPLGGLLALIIAVFAVRMGGRAGNVLIPAVGTNGIVFLLCLTSLPLRRPFAAWTSYFTRHYPLSWYWHPRVRPAYSEVTFLWAAFFGIRLFMQILLLRSENSLQILLFSFFSGWPAIAGLLAVSYLYGTWRLRDLGGPGVDEFRRGDPPPWKGQKRGF